MELIDLINLLSSIASLILSIIAIWLSLWFYEKSKNSEKNSEILLNNIKTQSESLERLTAKWMDRFTKYVTNPKEADETVKLLLSSFQKNSEIDNGLVSADQKVNEKISNEMIIRLYIVIYFYSSLTNISTQSYLPQLNQLEHDNILKNIVDASYSDVLEAESFLNQIDSAELNKNKLYSIYKLTKESYRSSVKDVTTVYAERERSKQDNI